MLIQGSSVVPAGFHADAILRREPRIVSPWSSPYEPGLILPPWRGPRIIEPWQAAVTVGNTSSGSANNANIDFAHVLGTGSDLVLVCGISLDAGLTVTSVSWDADGVNEAFLQLTNAAQDNPAVAHVDIWYLVGPSVATGASEVGVVASAKAQNIAGAITFLGATTPDNATGSVPDGVTSVSDTVSGVGADDFAFDVFRSPGSSPTEGANQTAQWNQTAGGGQGAGSTQDGVDGGVMSWSWASAADVAHSACRIPAAAAAADPPHLFDHFTPARLRM